MIPGHVGPPRFLARCHLTSAVSPSSICFGTFHLSYCQTRSVSPSSIYFVISRTSYGQPTQVSSELFPLFFSSISVYFLFARLRTRSSFVSSCLISLLKWLSLSEKGLSAFKFLIISLDIFIDLTSITSSIANPMQDKRRPVDTGWIWGDGFIVSLHKTIRNKSIM